MSDRRRWVIGTLLAVLAGAAAVLACYFLVDRPVASWVHAQHLGHFWALKDLTLPPPWAQAWSPLLLVLLAARWAYGPLRPWQIHLATAAVALVLADQFRESLSLVLARYWPETWRGNASWIGDGTFGFALFASGKDFGSFPSGHMARTAAVAAVAWLAYPRWRWLGVLALALEAVGLIGMNYHFVGDVLGGTALGAIVGAWCWKVGGSRPLPQTA